MSYTPHQITVPPVTPMVKRLIIVTCSVWVILQLILDKVFDFPFIQNFGLVPGKVIFDFFLWQPLTYLFLHANHLTHIVFNMLLLWLLGSELEQRWGSRLFLNYYLVSGVGAGVIYTIVVFVYTKITGDPKGMFIPVVGASGSVFGLMLAYGILFGERIVHFMFIFPMKAKFFVLLLGVIELITLLNVGVAGGSVANLAHLGGLVSGFLFLFCWTRSQRKNWRQGQALKKAKERKKRIEASNLHVISDDKSDDDPKDPNGDPNGGPKYWN